MNWKTKIHTEFELAYAARADENEGKARVCARRAAGIAIREYLIRREIVPSSVSAYDLLKVLEDMDETPADQKEAAAYLRLRVTEEFRLPVDVDLIAEAKKICDALFPEWDE